MTLRPLSAAACLVSFGLIWGLAAAPIREHELSRAAPAVAPRLIDQIGGSGGLSATDGDVVFVAIGPRIKAYRTAVTGGPPLLLGSSGLLPGLVSDMAISEHRLYLGLWELGLWILDIRDPAKPQVLGNLRTVSSIYNLEVASDLVYIAAGTAGLRVVDVHDPAQPLSLTTVPIPDRDLEENVTRARHVQIVGRHALVFFSDEYSDDNLAAIFDLSEPSLPRHVAIVDLEIPCRNPSIALAGTMLYMVCNYQLYALDVSNPEFTRIVGQARFPNISATGIALFGRYAVIGSSGYMPQEGLGIAVVDISQYEAMKLVGFLETRAGTESLSAIGSTAFVVDNSSTAPDGLRQVDISNPAMPRDQGRVDWIGSVTKIAASGSRIIAAEQNSIWSLLSKDLSALGRLGLPVGRMVLSAEKVYVVEYQGLHILDGRSDGTPAQLGELMPDLPGLRFVGVAASPPLAYVLATTAGNRNVEETTQVIVVDVSEPAKPTILGRVEVPSAAGRLVSWRQRVLVAIGPRIRMIDVSKPALPLDVGGWTMAADVKAMALASDDDGYIFVAVGNQVRSFDIRDADQPHEVGFITLPAPVTALDVGDGRAVVTLAHPALVDRGFANEVRFLSTQDPANLTDLGGLGLPSVVGTPIEHARLLGDIAYLAAGPVGLLVVQAPRDWVSQLSLPFALAPRGAGISRDR